jgi:quercetin dioxygenase-like cupin family protein
MHNLKKALESILEKDKEYRIICHQFKNGKEVKTHKHPNANEWIFVNRGKFDFTIDGKTRSYDLDKAAYEKIFVPKGAPHSMSVYSNVTYFVVRDGEAETEYL